jgi:hypothetical protein
MQRLDVLLREEGIAVEMLPGIERDANTLQLELASDEGPTIYVLANSKVLAGGRLEALVQMFATERGPAHRLLVLDVDSEDPSRMVLPVMRAHAAMRKHRSSGELPRRPTTRGAAIAAQPSAPRKTPSATPRAERQSTSRSVAPLGIDLDAVDVDVLRPGRASDDRYAFGLDLPAPVTNARASTEYGNEQRRGDREVIQLPTKKRRSSQEIPRVLDASRRATPTRQPTPARPATRARKPAPMPIGPQRRMTPREIGVIVEVRPPHDPRAEPTSASTSRTLGKVEPKPASQQAARRSNNRAVWLGLAGLAVVLSAVVLVADPPGDDSEGTVERGIAASSIANPSERERPAQQPKRSATKQQPEPDAKQAEPQPREPKPLPVLRDPVEEAQQIAAAVEAKRIHALDALLFVTPVEAPIEWSAAEHSCKDTAIDRIGGWRLPSVAEARKLRGARRLRPGRYWTDLSAPDGTVPVVASSGGPPSALAKSDSALVVCVRRRIG